jgi:hypothetical protein
MKSFIPIFEEFENQYNSFYLNSIKEESDSDSSEDPIDMDDDKLFKRTNNIPDNGIAAGSAAKVKYERPKNDVRMRSSHSTSNRTR